MPFFPLPRPILPLLAVCLTAGTAAAQDGPPQREEVARRAQEIAGRISASRGLAQRRPIRADVLSREGLVELMRKRLREETPPEEIHAEGVLLERLGMIESADQYEAIIYDMLEGQIAGLYDPDDRTLYVLNDLSSLETDLTLWHEIVHALQDQNYQIGDRQDALDDDGDRSFAFSAVCEGDATLTSTALQVGGGWAALEWLIPSDVEALRSLMSPGDYGVPSALIDVLSFPYVEGVAFANGRFHGGGVAALDDLFRRPPESTEQVIHPEKYLAGDPPVPLRFLPVAEAFPGHRLAYDDTFGEFVIRVWLQLFLSPEEAVGAATGWGGDRLALLVSEGEAVEGGACAGGARPLDDRLWACGAAPDCGDSPFAARADGDGWLVWATTWDGAAAGTEAPADGEAIEFQAAAVAALTARLLAPNAPSPDGPVAPGDPPTPADEPPGTEAPASDWIHAGPLGTAGVRRAGRDVLLVIGPPERAAEVPGLLDELAHSTERRAADLANDHP